MMNGKHIAGFVALVLTGVMLWAGDVSAQDANIRVAEWYALGPLGHPDLKMRSGDARSHPGGEKEFRAWLHFFKIFIQQFNSGMWPMDPQCNGVFDLDATYKGPITQDGNGVEQTVAWQKISIDNDSAQIPATAKGMGLVYFVTWIHADETIPAKYHLTGYRGEDKKGSAVTAWVNGGALRSQWVRKDVPLVQQPSNGQEIILNQGWNLLCVRHVSAWRGICNATVLSVPAGMESKIRITAEPPAEVGRRFTVAGKAAGPAGPGEKAPPVPVAMPVAPAAAKPAAPASSIEVIPVAPPARKPEAAPAPAPAAPAEKPREISIW